MLNGQNSRETADRTHEIRKLNNYVNALMNSASTYSLLLDRDAKILCYSDRLLRLMGIADGSPFVGMPLLDAFMAFKDQKFITAASRRLSRVMSGENEFTEDDTVLWPNGEKRIHRITYSRIVDENCDFEGIVIVSYDITGLRMEEAERRLDDLLRSTSLPCTIWDEKGDVVAYNKEAACVFGASEGLSPEAFNAFFLCIQPKRQPDGRETERMRQGVIHDALTKGFAQITVQLAKNDGEPLYFMVNIARISWVFGYRLIVYYYDMADMMIKEAAAKEAEKRIKLMLDSTPMMCILRDDQGNIIDCNQEALNILGVSCKTDFCKNYNSFFPEFQPDGVRSADREEELGRIVDEKGTHTVEQTFRTPAGELIPVHSTIVRIPWKDTYYYLSYSLDLREKKADEQKMQEIAAREREAKLQKEAALAANEAKSQFLAHMSHEIRTPMNAILGMSDLLLQENLGMRQLRYVKDIHTSAMALLEIINDILDVSKLQAGKLQLVPVHYDFSALIDNISAIVQLLVKDKDIAFILAMKESAPVCLYGDDVRLRQVLLNLLGNAIKFTHEGCIQLAISFTDTAVEISVSDTGIGIRTESLPALFDAFEQFDTIKNRNTEGTGLGLTITKSIVEMMSGEITVESTYGQGTTFHVKIPKVLGDAALIHHADSKEITLYAPDAKVLLVDDNTINLNVAFGLLQLCQITADTATSGKQAIELVRQNQYDIVFMDHMMPEMNGIEATRAIRELGIRMPIIALTASALPTSKKLMLEAGMNDYLAKPIVKTKLKYMLKKWIPAEKLLEPSRESAVPNEVEGEKREDFWKKMMEIKGISLSAGLNRVGGQRSVYEKSLKLMMQEIVKSDENLNAFLSASDMDRFRIEAHGIKGALDNIGALELSAKAYCLETASARKDSDFCAANLPFFLEELNGLYLSMKEAFSVINQSDRPAEIPPEVPHIFKNLTVAFDEMDLVFIEKEIEKLNALKLNGALREEIEQIKDNVMMMNYDAAVEQMEKLLRNA